MSAGVLPPGMPPAVIVHGAAELEALLAAAAGHRFTMLSMPGAAGSLGPRAWLALAARAGDLPALLCCGAAPGHALAALRAGCRELVLEGGTSAFPAVASAAREVSALLLPVRPLALDPRPLDLRRPGGRARLLAWLCTPSPDDRAFTLG
ncbi:MAG TPA: hypothetical protein VE033_06555 [Acetobacteraceae bacterium]|nr:hypothetical protein [Acetobacteraceae bacterium]